MATRRRVTRKARPTTRRMTRKTAPRKNSFHKVAKVWTRQEISFLRKYYRNHDTTWCAKQLGRTVYSIRYKACDLSIRKGNPSTWKNPGRGKVTFTAKTTTHRKVTRPKKNVRWAKTRQNNRRTKW